MLMFGIPIRVPFLLVMLLAGLWVFALAWWKPELLEQKPVGRLYTSILESLVCGFLWGVILSHLSNDPLEGLVLSSLLAGFFWFSVVFYSRQRYAESLKKTLYITKNSERHYQ